MKKYIIGCLALCLIMAMGCQKEESFEVGNKPSDGSLLSEITGDCLPKTVNGTYVAAEPLVPATNTITVSVNVRQTGAYTVYTDTVNGYFFRATGIFVTLGTNTVTLRSNGTPFSAGVNNFVVNYDSTVCDIAITVLPVGTKPAVYTLETTAGNCSGAVVGGSYAITNPLNFTNTVKISVNVTTIGTYTISTTATNGMTFSGTGSFTTTGVQLVTLAGTGTPVTNGNTTFPLTVGTTTCNFVVPVGNPAIGTLGTTAAACTPANVSGTYTVGTALVTTANTVQIQVNVTTVGVYSINTTTVAGITFAASGAFTITGPQSLTLNGTGNPTSGGTKTFTVTFGTSTCTFDVPVSGPAGGAVFTVDCSSATPNGTYTELVPLNSTTNTVDIDVNVTTPGTYNITGTVNGMTFSKSGTFATAGVTSITLIGSGTPTADGTFNVPMQGTTPCTFPIDVDPGSTATIDWKFTEGTTTIFQGSTLAALLVPTNIPPIPPFLSLAYTGMDVPGNQFGFNLIDPSSAINASETYSTVISAGNSAVFTFMYATGGDQLTTDATRNITFTVDSHNTTTKTIVGRFSGQAKNNAGATKTISGGTFTAAY